MKKLLFLFVLIAFKVHATNYYFAASGNDSNPGTKLLPYLTLAKATSVLSTAAPGDSLFFNRGDSFYGYITTGANGTALANIYIGAYGTGAYPVWSGFTTASGWTSVGSGVWASTAVSTLATCNYVLINGGPQGMGRIPNIATGYYPITSANSTSITGALSGTPNWTGATIVCRTVPYMLEKATITSQSGGTITYGGFGSGAIPAAGNGYFIENDIRTLATLGDWYYNPSSKIIDVYFGVSVGTNTVQCASVQNILTINNDYINIQNITITGANNYGVNTTGTRIGSTVQNCNIQDCHYGVVSGSLNVLNCNINNINQDGIQENGPLNISIYGNTVTKIGLLTGMSFGQFYGIYCLNTPSNVSIDHNIVKSTGYTGISVIKGTYMLIHHNYVDTVCLITHDGGGIYVDDQGNTTLTGNKMYNNLVMNSIGSAAGLAPYANPPLANGLYLDDFSNNWEVYNNTVGLTSNMNIMMHNIHDNNIHDNKFYSGFYNAYFANDNGSYAQNNKFQNNEMFAVGANQYCIGFQYSIDNIAAAGIVNYNTYCKPYDETRAINTYVAARGTSLFFTLAGWQTAYSNLDQNSTKTPSAYQGGTNIFLYHSPLTNQTYSSDGSYQTPNGNFSFFNGQVISFPLYVGGLVLKVGSGIIYR